MQAGDRLYWERLLLRMRMVRRLGLGLIATLLVAAMTYPAQAQAQRAAAPADAETRIGTTAPYTGPASAYGVIAKVIAAYLDKVNAEGGINGRNVTMISYDDAYDPKKTLELTRKLVEQDDVLFTLGAIGTNTNAAIQPYLNSKKVPSFLPSRAPRPGTSRASFPGPSASCRPTRRKPRSTRSTCSKTINAARSPSSIRRTGWARST